MRARKSPHTSLEGPSHHLLMFFKVLLQAIAWAGVVAEDEVGKIFARAVLIEAGVGDQLVNSDLNGVAFARRVGVNLYFMIAAEV